MANNKSAISLLQEVSIKQGFLPIYNFMEKRIDGSTQFTCNVSCKQLNTCGTGSSKKEAKYNAAKNMLLLFDTNKIPLPIDALSSSSVPSVIESPAKVYETSPSSKQSTVGHNYIGLLQEFCQQQRMSTQNIVYNLVYDEGLPHLKMFTIEVSIGSLRERASAQCKKTAKQEAARKLLLHLNPNIANTAILLDINKLDVYDKETLENNIQKLDTRILDRATNEETLSIAKLSEKAKSLYIQCTQDKRYTKTDQETNPSVMKNIHTLFERNYSSKIQYSMREKMRIIRDKCSDQTDLVQIRWEIENLLKIKIQQIAVYSTTKNCIICLRLLSNPCITQFGMGETRFVADSRAMYNLVEAILMFLNV